MTSSFLRQRSDQIVEIREGLHDDQLAVVGCGRLQFLHDLLLTGVFRLCLVLSVLLPGEDGLVVLPELDGLSSVGVVLGDGGDITTQIHLVRARCEVELLRARLLGAPDGFVDQFHC